MAFQKTFFNKVDVFACLSFIRIATVDKEGNIDRDIGYYSFWWKFIKVYVLSRSYGTSRKVAFRALWKSWFTKR